MKDCLPKFHHLLIAIVSVIFMASLSEPTHAQRSLFESRDENMVFLFQDLKARRVGDLLTIVVSENTDVSNQDQRANKKATSHGGKYGLSYGLGGAFGTSGGDATASVSAGPNRKFDGDSSFSSDRSFSDRFTVQIVDILPNGNLIVSGTRKVNVENDQRSLKLTGIVRGWDIAADNTVNSRQVANLSLEYQGRGPEQSFTRQGWLGRKVNKIWPF